MKYSGLFYLPAHNATDNQASSLQHLINNLTNQYPHLTTRTPWHLNHRLLRTTARATSTDQSQPPQSYQHILNLSYHPQQTYFYIHPHSTTQPSPDNSSIIAVPNKQVESLYTLLTGKLSALWQQRQTLQINSGTHVQIGLFTIHLGELRLLRSGTGAASSTPVGTIICISSTLGPDEEAPEGTQSSRTLVGSQEERESEKKEWEEAVKETRGMIRAFWDGVKGGLDGGKEGVKEVWTEAGWEDFGKGRAEEKERWAEVRMWCEILKLRN